MRPAPVRTCRGHYGSGMIAILGAMQEEVRAIAAAVEGGEGGEGRRSVQAGPMRVETGRLAGRAIAVGFSGWGKVASASNTVRLVQACRTVWGHGPEALLFVGVAGALDDRLAVGDIVVADELWQHDLDASPLFAPMQIPLTDKTSLRADEAWSARLEAAGRGLLADGLAGMITPSALASVGLDASPPRVWRGGIATGDQFVCDAGTRAAIKRRIPGALAVEMEGAAVAQVCADEGVPLAAVRVISDSADAHAPASFATFVEQVADVMLVEIVRRAVAVK